MKWSMGKWMTQWEMRKRKYMGEETTLLHPLAGRPRTLGKRRYQTLSTTETRLATLATRHLYPSRSILGHPRRPVEHGAKLQLTSKQCLPPILMKFPLHLHQRTYLPPGETPPTRPLATPLQLLERLYAAQLLGYGISSRDRSDLPPFALPRIPPPRRCTRLVLATVATVVQEDDLELNLNRLYFIRQHLDSLPFLLPHPPRALHQLTIPPGHLLLRSSSLHLCPTRREERVS